MKTDLISYVLSISAVLKLCNQAFEYESVAFNMYSYFVFN